METDIGHHHNCVLSTLLYIRAWNVMGRLVCLVILQLNAAAAKGRQHVNIQLAKELQQVNIC